MNLDSDTIVKNRFWILLGVAATLNLVAWVVMLISVPSKVGATQKDIETRWKGARKDSGVVTRQEVEAQREEASKAEATQGSSWQNLYKKQAAEAKMTLWPRDLSSIVNGKYAVEIVLHPKKAAELPKADDTHVVGILGESNTYVVHVKTKGKDKGKEEDVVLDLTEDVKVTESTKPDVRLEVSKLSSSIGRPVVVTFYEGKYFGDKFSSKEWEKYAKTYQEQLKGLFQELGPVNDLGKTVVQFRYSPGGGPTGPGGIQPPRSFGPGIPPGGFDTKGAPGAEDELNGHMVGDIYRPFDKDGKFKPPPADNRFFSYVAEWNFKKMYSDAEGKEELAPDAKADAISEEIWIAQENLWVQRELFKRLKVANDAVAAFTVDAKNSGDSKTKPIKLKNYYWEMDLKLTGENKVHVVLRNLRPYQQEINDLHFLLHVQVPDGKTKTKTVRVLFPPRPKEKEPSFTGQPLAPLGARETKDGKTFIERDKLDQTITVPNLPANALAITGADQELTWKTAAVKRIDVVVVGGSASGDTALSHRQGYKKLVPYKEAKKPADDSSKDTPTDPKADPGKDVPGPDKKGFPGGIPGPGGKDFGGSGGVSTTRHGLVRERYVDKPAETRKLPICLILIVDPDHKNLVEAALVDSPLRFLTTQVLWQRYQGSLQPPDEVTKTTEGGTPGEGTPSGPGPFPMPGVGPSSGGNNAAAGTGDEPESIEFAIYGVITIYERPGRQVPGGTPPAQPPTGESNPK
jgi:hypothetical protein